MGRKMKEYILLLLITYVIWLLLAKIVSNSYFKNIWIMPVLFITYIAINEVIKDEYHLSEKLVIMLGLWLILDDEPREKLRSITTVIVFSNVLETIVCAMEKIFNAEIKTTVKPEIYVKLVCIFILLVMYFIKKHRNLKDRQENYDLDMYMLIWVFGVAATVVIDYFRYNTYRLYDYTVVLSVSVVFNLLLSVIFLVYIIISNDIINRFYNMEKKINEEQKIYYEMLLQKEEETKKFRHDITNQLINIRKLAEESEDKKVIDYTSEISSEIENIGNMVYKTENKIIDVMLNYYICKLNKGIQVYIKGVLGEDICVRDSDLNIIFGNIFKNIWQELKNCDDGFIRIECKTGNEYSSIVIENSLNSHRRNKTVKKDRKFGYGIENIKGAAKRNNITFKCEKTKEKYCTELVFKNKKL